MLNWSDLSQPPCEDSVFSLIAACYGAIDVRTGANPEDERVQLKHDWLRDGLTEAGHFIGPRDLISPFDLGQAWYMHAMLGVNCLKYLMLDSDCSSREYVHQLKSKDFMEYAARNFDSHLLQGKTLSGRELRPLRKFLTRDDALLNWFFNFRTCDLFKQRFGKQDLNQDPVTIPEIVCATKMYQSKQIRDVWLKNGPGDYGLHAALLCGVSENISSIIRTGCNINALDRRGMSPLVYAAETGDLVIVKMLLEAGADPNLHSQMWQSALAAAHNKQGEQVHDLLERYGGDPQTLNERQTSALLRACSRGDEEAVRMLVADGTNVNDRTSATSSSGTALYRACQQGSKQIVQLLLENHADANVMGGTYGFPMQAACIGGHTRIVEMLLQAGANPNIQGGLYGSALQAAAFRGSQEIAEMLIEADADLHAEGGAWGHALFAAAYQGAGMVVSVLLSQGVDVNEPSPDLGNALCIVCRRGHLELVELLLDSGVDVNAVVNVKTGSWRFSNALEAILQGQARSARKGSREWGRYNEILSILRPMIGDLNVEPMSAFCEDWIMVESSTDLPIRQ